MCGMHHPTLHRLLAAAALLAACGGGTADDTTAGTPDASSTPDVVADTGPDVVADAGPDTAPDVTADTAPDATADPAPDVAPETCEDQPTATPPEVAQGEVDGSKFLYAIPASPQRLLLFFHGTGGSRTTIVNRPEAVLMVQDLLAAGFAVAAIDSDDRVAKQWNKVDGPDNVDIEHALGMHALLTDPDELGLLPPNIPVFALGGSNGGTFVSRLAQVVPLRAAVVQISHAQIFHDDGATVPPLFLVPAAQDSIVPSGSLQGLAADLDAAGVDVELHLNEPAPLTPGHATRIDGVDCDLSMAIRDALADAGHLSPSGLILERPADSGWEAALPAAAPSPA